MKKGILFGIIGNLFVGFQPIIVAFSPSSLDAFIFAAATCLIEAALFFPIMLINQKINNSKSKNSGFKPKPSLLKAWKNHFWLFMVIGVIFGLNQALFILGYRMTGSIIGSLLQKTTVFFGLVFGFLILKEKVTRKQILFSILLFIGLAIAITQGSFAINNFSIEIISGIFILLVITCLWMYGHTITKPVFKTNEITPIQMVFVRNFLSGIMLLFVYTMTFQISNLSLLLEPINQFYYIIFGLIYGLGLFCWYNTLSYLDVSKATIIFSPTPIITAIFSTIILGSAYTVFHLIGTFLVIISIYVIVRQK
ncbi:MAG: DMT family transporter [Candidatus Hermodarchaeota archaeon]